MFQKDAPQSSSELLPTIYDLPRELEQRQRADRLEAGLRALRGHTDPAVQRWHFL
jgi:hypothetical protein